MRRNNATDGFGTWVTLTGPDIMESALNCLRLSYIRRNKLWTTTETATAISTSLSTMHNETPCYPQETVPDEQPTPKQDKNYYARTFGAKRKGRKR